MKKEYVAYIDFKAGHSESIRYEKLHSDNVIDAMREAEAFFDEDVYLIDLMESGAIRKTKEDGMTYIRTSYHEILCTRDGKRWHLHDEQHWETSILSHYHYVYIAKDGHVLDHGFDFNG